MTRDERILKDIETEYRLIDQIIDLLQDYNKQLHYYNGNTEHKIEIENIIEKLIKRETNLEQEIYDANHV